MARINYDFEELERAVEELKRNPASHVTLNKLRTELNRLFKDSFCKEIIYTRNTDKLFFGMCVIPYINSDMTEKILGTDEKIRLNEYFVEIDSKLLTSLSLTTRELTAILLHEIGHIVNDTNPVDEARNIIDLYLAKNNEHLILSDATQYREILAFALKDTIRKITTLFEKDEEEILADRFVHECGYGIDLENALSKILNNTRRLNKGVSNKLIVLQWTLRLYKDVKHNRIPALHTLRKSKKVEPTTLLKREIDAISRRLEEIDDDFIIGEASGPNISGIFSKVYKKFKYNGIKMFEEDFYELALLVKNTDEKEEAIDLMRKINTRISVIDEYLREEDLEDSEREKWVNLLTKYEQLRKDLSKKNTYEKYLGLFAPTPVIKNRYEV